MTFTTEQLAAAKKQLNIRTQMQVLAEVQPMPDDMFQTALKATDEWQALLGKETTDATNGTPPGKVPR